MCAPGDGGVHAEVHVLMTPTERAYVTLCWTVWMAGVDLWWERWGLK
jgi:hypothetical protein